MSTVGRITRNKPKNLRFYCKQTVKYCRKLHSVFFPRFPVVLGAVASLPALAALLWATFPVFTLLVGFATLVESELPSPPSFTSAFLAFGFFAGATLEEVASSFLDFLGGFVSCVGMKINADRESHSQNFTNYSSH